MSTRWMVALSVLLILASTGCDGSDPVSPDTNPPQQDSGVDLLPDVSQPDVTQPDASIPQDLPQADQQPDVKATDALPDGLPDSGPGGDKEFVISRFVLPTSATAPSLGVDYNNDGTVDNTLGAILGVISAMAPSIDLQQGVDNSVNSGAALQLLRLTAGHWVTDHAAKAHTWTAAPQQCCTTVAIPFQCAVEAKQTCFSGTHTFSPDPSDPAGTALPGEIVATQFDFGPEALTLKIPLVGTGVLELNLKAVHFRGTLQGNTISNGVLAGAVTQSDLQNKIIPKVAQMLNSILLDPNTDAITKSALKTGFDTDNDGHISTQEVASNTLFKTLLAGDVDVDNDGTPELSLGLGFEAATAVIK